MRTIKVGSIDIELTCGDALKVREFQMIQPIWAEYVQGKNDFLILGQILSVLAKDKEAAKEAYNNMEINEFELFALEIQTILDVQKKTI